MAKIVLDPGHYCRPGVYVTPGKRSPQIPPGIYEGEFTCAVALLIGAMLETNGHVVLYTHRNDLNKSPTLTQRRRLGNGGDLFVSIHANASGVSGWSKGTGFVVFCNSAGRPAAEEIAESMGCVLPYPPRRNAQGVVEQYISDAMPRLKPSVLVECGMMTNRDDAAFMRSKEGREIISCAVFNGILRGLPKLEIE